MQLRFGFLAVIALVLLPSAIASRAQTAPACSATAADKDAVAQTLRTMYKAATADDLALFHTVAAPGFYAFDGGKRWDGDSLMNYVKTLHASGDLFVWTVNDPQVVLDCNSALITYVNRGSVTTPRGKQDLSWLESAYLQKQAGQWRIEFFHSTRVPQAPPQ